MKHFVFRNNTVEVLFGVNGYEYSGYEDISYIPDEVDAYIWFYQSPIAYNQKVIAEKIDVYIEKLQLVYSQLPKNKNLILFTLVDLYPVRFILNDYSVRTAISKYNQNCYELATDNQNVKILDFNDFASQYSIRDLIHWRFYFNSQTIISPMLASAFKKWFDSQCDKIALKRKKCIALDLDNTLWGGVLGEEGIDGIQIGGDYPGKAFLYFQEALAELGKQGIILIVCSKNNINDVLEVWEKNPFIILRKNSFAAYRINWNNKADNLKEMSEELNIGLDSFVFIDDSPTEREFIKQTLPMVEVPDFPDKPYMLPAFFNDIVDKYFGIYSITDEDKKKVEQYKANAERNQEQKKFTDIIGFIRSLDIKIDIIPANKFNIPRIAQMTQKTNQFNLTTHRYTDSDIRLFIDNGWKIYCIDVSDRFGDNGIVGCIMINGSDIDTLLLSCRILGKNIEYAFINAVLNLMKNKGYNILTAQYIQTKKNSQVHDFYDKIGFSLIKVTDESHIYKIDLRNKQFNVPDYYNISINND
jgi:FkbH-like protein